MKEKILSIISVLAMVEFIAGAVLVEGGAFGIGILAMVMPLAWFGIILLKVWRIENEESKRG